MWQTYWKDKTIFIVPVNDLAEHFLDTACACNPLLFNAGDHFRMVHNAYDGREWFEIGWKRNFNKQICYS